MNTKKRNVITLISLLSIFVIVSTVFVIAFTFAGSPQRPDATAIYTRNNLRWDVPTDAAGIAKLNIFGDPKPGDKYPLIHPGSADTYYLRIQNNEFGFISYSVFLYTDDNNEIPLKFDVTQTEEMKTPSFTPSEVKDKKILSSFAGQVDPVGLKNFEINWYWDTKSDADDTLIGNSAAASDLIYNLNVLVIIEDNNNYIGKLDSISSVRMRHQKYISGYPDGSFKPDKNMSRAEVSAVIARIDTNFDEGKLTKTKTGFSDVSASHWAAKYISRLVSEDIVNGYKDGSFLPANNITRAEFAAICVRFAEKDGKSIKNPSSDFDDVPKSHWAKEYIDKANKAGFVSGYPDGSFKPDKKVTRAEVVTVINRMLSRFPDKSYIDKHISELHMFEDISDRTHWAYYDIVEAANEHLTWLRKNSEVWILTMPTSSR